MTDDEIERFVAMMGGPEVVTLVDQETGDLIDMEVLDGGLTGGWMHFFEDGSVEQGEFWREPGGVLETKTEIVRPRPQRWGWLRSRHATPS